MFKMRGGVPFSKLQCGSSMYMHWKIAQVVSRRTGAREPAERHARRYSCNRTWSLALASKSAPSGVTFLTRPRKSFTIGIALPTIPPEFGYLHNVSPSGYNASNCNVKKKSGPQTVSAPQRISSGFKLMCRSLSSNSVEGPRITVSQASVKSTRSLPFISPSPTILSRALWYSINFVPKPPHSFPRPIAWNRYPFFNALLSRILISWRHSVPHVMICTSSRVTCCCFGTPETTQVKGAGANVEAVKRSKYFSRRRLCPSFATAMSEQNKLVSQVNFEACSTLGRT
mmetsp:Transcript_9202/g.24143  ORF Transcript_9202/g.24143 Transcript_9202/m.24143 type:complete len:285 (+) Transcript_9202:555-1409(+)